MGECYVDMVTQKNKNQKSELKKFWKRKKIDKRSRHNNRGARIRSQQSMVERKPDSNTTQQ